MSASLLLVQLALARTEVPRTQNKCQDVGPRFSNSKYSTLYTLSALLHLLYSVCAFLEGLGAVTGAAIKRKISMYTIFDPIDLNQL